MKAKLPLVDPLIYKEQYRTHKKKIKDTNKKLWAGNAHTYLKHAPGTKKNRTYKIKLSFDYTGIFSSSLTLAGAIVEEMFASNIKAEE